MSQCLINENKHVQALDLQAISIGLVDVKDEYILFYVKNLIQQNNAIKAEVILKGFLERNPNDLELSKSAYSLKKIINFLLLVHGL